MVNPNHITPYGEIDRAGARAGRRPRVQPPRRRAGALHRPLRGQGPGGGGRGGRPHRGHGARGGAALAHPAPQEGRRGGPDRRVRGEDRRRPDAQRRAAAGHEGGRRQVRRGRADPAVRAPERRGDEARRRPAGELPGQARGLHEGHGRAGHGVRRRARHRQVAGQHDPHQQRLLGRRPRQAGADPDDPRGGQGARRDGDRPVRAAGLHLQADAAGRAGAAGAGPRVPGAAGRRGDQPQVRAARALPRGQGGRHGLRPGRLLLQGRLRGPRRDGPAHRARPPRGAGGGGPRGRRRAARGGRDRGGARLLRRLRALRRAHRRRGARAAVLGRARDRGRPRGALHAPGHPRAVQAALGRQGREGRGVAAPAGRGLPAAAGAHVERGRLPAPAGAARLLPLLLRGQRDRRARPGGPRDRDRALRLPAPGQGRPAVPGRLLPPPRTPASSTSSRCRPSRSAPR